MGYCADQHRTHAPINTPLVLPTFIPRFDALLDRVDRLAESMLSAASGGSIERLRQSVELLLMTTLRDLVRQGREHELGPLLVETRTFGAK